MTEAWLTKSELIGHLRICERTLERCYPLFKQGIHYRLKNPAGSRKHRLWKLSKVEEVLMQPHPNAVRQIKR